jgi:hypothetical protein
VRATLLSVMVVIVAKVIAPEGPADRKVIGATTVGPAGEAVGAVASARIADSAVHVHEKSLVQKLALIAAKVGGLGVVVAIYVSVSSKIKSYTRTYTQAHSPLLCHLLLLFSANSLLDEPKAFALNECPWQVVSARLLLV